MTKLRFPMALTGPLMPLANYQTPPILLGGLPSWIQGPPSWSEDLQAGS